MNTKTRIIALLITLVMLASMLPVMTLTVSAEETTDPSKAKVGILKADGTYRKYYTELTKAVFDTASADETVQLLGNCVVDQNNTTRGLQITGEDTLDLNGYVLTPKLSTCRLFHVCMNATFTIKDSRPDAIHQYTENGSLYVWDNDTGTGSITLCGGAITGGVTNTNTSDYAAGNGGAIFVQGGTLIIEGGNFVGNQADGSGSVIFTDQVKDNSTGIQYFPTLIIGGGLFVGNKAAGGSNYLIHAFHLKKSCVYGGTFSDDLSLTQALPCLEGYELVYNKVRTNCWSVVSEYETPDLDTTENSLFIKGIQRSANFEGMCSIRVIAEVKRNKITNNTYAGFDITANGKTVRLPVKKYYTKLLAQGTSGNAIAQTITPTSDDYVLIALVIENIPTANKPVDLYITPYIKVDSNAEEKGTTVLFELFENVVELSDNARQTIAPPPSRHPPATAWNIISSPLTAKRPSEAILGNIHGFPMNPALFADAQTDASISIML